MRASVMDEIQLRVESPYYPNFLSKKLPNKEHVISTLVMFQYQEKWYSRHIVAFYPPLLSIEIIEGVFRKFLDACFQTQLYGVPGQYDKPVNDYEFKSYKLKPDPYETED